MSGWDKSAAPASTEEVEEVKENDAPVSEETSAHDWKKDQLKQIKRELKNISLHTALQYHASHAATESAEAVIKTAQTFYDFLRK